MIKHTLALALSVAALTLPASANAATQLTSVSTGQGATNTQDTKWKVKLGTASPFSAWIPNAVNTAWIGTTGNSGTSGAKWITPNQNGNSTIPSGTLTFSTTFDMSALSDLSTAILSGKIWSDNGVLALKLNGFTFFTSPNPGAAPNVQTFGDTYPGFNFSTASNGGGFLSGAVFNRNNNLFEVVIAQGTGPSGLLVAGGAEAMQAVPEPGTWMLMLLGFAAIGFAMRSRAKTQVRFQFA